MNNFLLFLGAVLVVVLAALFAVPHFIDWNVYRSSFESQAGKILGRDVRVGGQVSMRLLPAPYVSFENVRVADQDGRFSEPPLRVEAFTIWLSIPPLLRGTVEASEVDLRKPDFLVRLREPQAGEQKGADGALSAVPVSIVLRSVNIHQGTMRIVDAAGDETLRLDKVNGEFAAPSLEGPFRFRGTLEHHQHERDVRVVTGKLEPNGTFGIDATIRAVEQAITYQLSGRLTGADTSPVYSGDLTVKPAADRRRATAKPGSDAGDDLLPSFEVKSRLRLTTREAELADLNVMFEQAGTPQILSGRARAVFARPGAAAGSSVEAALTARWLDLDRISGTDGKGGPLPTLTRLGALGNSWRPADVGVSVRIGIEQATLGADTLQGIDLAVEQNRDKLQLTRLVADMPGGGRVDVAGAMIASKDGGPDAATFEGPFKMHGQSLNRFLAWVAPGHGLQMEDGVGSFALAGDLSVARDRIGMARIRGEIVATAFRGDAGFAWRDRPALQISIDSDRLDLRPFAKGGLKLSDFARILSGEAPDRPGTPTGAAPKAVTPLADRYAEIDSHFELRAGRLLLPEIELRDLSCDIRRTQRNTDVRVLEFATPAGLKFEADGQLQSAEGRQRGTIKGHVEVEQPAALETLVRFVDLPEANVLQGRASELMPLRLSGLLSLGARGGNGFELLIDGLAQETRTSLMARSDQDPRHWRDGTLDLTATLENRKSARLIAQLVPGTVPFSIGAADNGRLSVRAIGVVKTGISASIELETKAVETGFSGVIGLTGDEASLSGEIGLKSADVADSLRLAGLKGARALQGRDLVLHARVSAKAGEVRVSEATMRLGSASIEAKGRITRQRGRLDVDLAAKANEASLPAIMATAAGTGLGDGAADQKSAVSSDNVWSDEPIDLTSLADVGGKIKIEAGMLSLGQSLTLRNAVVEANVSESGVDIKSVSGTALGGRASGNVRIEKGAAGFTLQGTARLDGVRLERIADGGEPAVTGGAAGTLTFAGKGLTPRGMIATLAGKGTLQLAEVRSNRFGPEGLDTAVAQALPPLVDELEPTEIKNDAAVFKPIIADALKKSALAIGTRTVVLEIADGAVRTKGVAFDVPRGRVKASTVLDLATIRLDSEITIETLARFDVQARVARPGSAGEQAPLAAAPVPGVSLVVVGPLGELPTLEPRMNFDALARELLMRRLERDLQAMENARKRKDDAELLRKKMREEAERREDQARKAAADASSKAAPAATTGDALVVPMPVPIAPAQPPGASSPATAASPPSPAATASPSGSQPGTAVSTGSQGSSAVTPPKSESPPAALEEAAPASTNPRSIAPKNLAPKGPRPAGVFDPSKGL